MRQGRFNVTALLLLNEIIQWLPDRHRRFRFLNRLALGMANEMRRQIARQNHIFLA